MLLMSAPTRPNSSTATSRRFCVAPMMDLTDRHCRYFLRLLSREALLYTEMVTTGALLHGDRHRFLRHDPAEQPLALQLGGSDPAALASCARLGEEAGYREINLNVGCPSDRVQNNKIGACLMAEPGARQIHHQPIGIGERNNLEGGFGVEPDLGTRAGRPGRNAQVLDFTGVRQIPQDSGQQCQPEQQILKRGPLDAHDRKLSTCYREMQSYFP